MLEFCNLYSGSSGNSMLIKTNHTNILVDCGTSGKKICEGLASINSSIEDIDAILITHEHTDHIKSVNILSQKFNIPVYANLETWNAMKSQTSKISFDNIKYFKNDENFIFQDLIIHPFSIPHDAANPCGFTIDNGDKKLSIATDLGHMTDNIFNNLKESSFILLESNYDPEVLKMSKYPFMLKQRISGPKGHISNETAGKTISKLMDLSLKEVTLGHLSKESNFPELAYQTVTNELIAANKDLSKIKIHVAPRNNPGQIINL